VVSNLHHRLRPVAPSHANLQLSQQHAVAHGQLFSRHDVLLSGLAENVVWWVSISAESICMPVAWYAPLTVVIPQMQALCSRSPTEADTGNVEVGEERTVFLRPNGAPTTFTCVSVAMLRPRPMISWHSTLWTVLQIWEGQTACSQANSPYLDDFLTKRRLEYGHLLKNIWSCNAAFQMASSVVHHENNHLSQKLCGAMLSSAVFCLYICIQSELFTLASYGLQVLKF